LHNTVRGGRTARRPIERRVQRGEFHDDESPQLFLGIRKGAILYAPLSFLEAHRGCRLRHLKRIASDVGAGFDESLMVGPPSARVRVSSVAVPAGKSFR